MKEEKPKIDLQKILNQYVLDENGRIWNVLQSAKNPKQAFMRRKNKYVKANIIDIKQKIVDNTYKAINEHQWKKFVKEDNAYIEELTRKMLKRVILAQLLLELDDELIEDYEDDKRFRAVLERSNKETERIASNQYDRLYSVDKTILQNMMNEIDDMTSAMASIEVADFIHLNGLIKEFSQSPGSYRKENVELVKLD